MLMMVISNFMFDDVVCIMYYNIISYVIYSIGESVLFMKFLKFVRKLLWIVLECIIFVMFISCFCEVYVVYWSMFIFYLEFISVILI